MIMKIIYILSMTVSLVFSLNDFFVISLEMRTQNYLITRAWTKLKADECFSSRGVDVKSRRVQRKTKSL
jgi:hypothetical protein